MTFGDRPPRAWLCVCDEEFCFCPASVADLNVACAECAQGRHIWTPGGPRDLPPYRPARPTRPLLGRRLDLWLVVLAVAVVVVTVIVAILGTVWALAPRAIA